MDQLKDASAGRVAEYLSPGAVSFPHQCGLCAGPIVCRREVPMEMARVFSQVDLLLVPSLRDEMLTMSNFTRSAFAHVACAGFCRGF